MIIRKAALQAALAATTSENTRYYLDGCRAEPAAHRLVATDEHILLIVTDKYPQDDTDFPLVPGAGYTEDPEPLTIPAAVARKMIGAMPKRPTIPILGGAQLGKGAEDGTATITATDLTAPCTAVLKLDEQGRFPSYERCLPKPERESVKVVLAVDVLEHLIKAAKAIVDKRTAHLVFDVPTGKADRETTYTDAADAEGHRIEGPPGAVTSAVGVTIEGDDLRITGCAMPCRE